MDVDFSPLRRSEGTKGRETEGGDTCGPGVMPPYITGKKRTGARWGERLPKGSGRSRLRIRGMGLRLGCWVLGEGGVGGVLASLAGSPFGGINTARWPLTVGHHVNVVLKKGRTKGVLGFVTQETYNWSPETLGLRTLIRISLNTRKLIKLGKRVSSVIGSPEDFFLEQIVRGVPIKGGEHSRPGPGPAHLSSGDSKVKKQ